MNPDMRYIDPTEWAQRYAIEVVLPKSDNFLKIVETLTRMGIANHSEKTLTQSCHILQKGGKFYIVHFKELLALDGKPVKLDPEDILRRNRIIALLNEWELIKIVDRTKIDHQSMSTSFTIIPFRDKQSWNLKTKYQMGVRQ